MRRRPVVSEIAVSRIVIADRIIVPDLLIVTIALKMKADRFDEPSDTGIEAGLALLGRDCLHEIEFTLVEEDGGRRVIAALFIHRLSD